MYGLARLLFAVGICFPLLGAGPAALGQPTGLQITPAQTVKPADFTAVERNYYQGLDPAAAKNFIATRSYVRLCQQVLDRQLPALRLPDRPAGFTVKYLLPGEDNVINRALAASLVAKQNPNAAPPAPREMTSAQILETTDLTPKELDYYNKLTNPSAAKAFIETRSYVRLTRQVVAHELSPADLPDKPLGFSRSYLLAGEEAVVNQAIAASVAALMQQKLR